MNLVAERLNRGLSPEQAALAMGISRNTLVRAERGERLTPRPSKRIADFYDVRVTDIWPVDNDGRAVA